jgi:hypothetical protein
MLSRSIAAVSILLLSATGVRAATVSLQLQQTFREPFSLVRGVAELSDGRVLVADQREVSVYVADFRTGQRRRIGTVKAQDRMNTKRRWVCSTSGAIPLRSTTC